MWNVEDVIICTFYFASPQNIDETERIFAMRIFSLSKSGRKIRTGTHIGTAGCDLCAMDQNQAEKSNTSHFK